MIIRKTMHTKRKKIIINGSGEERKRLFQVYTYWFLFIPFYRFEVLD